MPHIIATENLHGDVNYLFHHFDRAESGDGWIAYKTFGTVFQPPSSWVIEEEATITQDLDMDTDDDCSYGVNVAVDVEWLADFDDRRFKVWEMFIPDDATIVIPWGTDGKIRVDKAVIKAFIGYVEDYEFIPSILGPIVKQAQV